jgi:hypothetical protein
MFRAKNISCSIAQLENLDPWSFQEGRGLLPTHVHPKIVLEKSIVVVDLDVHNDVVGHCETIK